MGRVVDLLEAALVETEVDGEKQWVPLYDYVSNLKRVSHGVCPGCLEQM